MPSPLFHQHNDVAYRTPLDLARTMAAPSRILMVGSCLLEELVASGEQFPGVPIDFVMINNLAQMPETPPAPASAYAFQVIQLSFRDIMRNDAYVRLDPSDESAYAAFFQRTVQYMKAYLNNSMRWNEEHGLLTFVLGFMTPQQNPLGRLLRRHDLRNLIYFTERLNEELERAIASFQNAWYVDTNQVVSTLGKKFSQDDMVWISTHQGVLTTADLAYDDTRIEPLPGMNEFYHIEYKSFLKALWFELLSLYRIIRQEDLVKAVVVDLDDTLWRGVAADGSLQTLEGWPSGFMEALVWLKQRGILLATASKNDPDWIRAHWDQITDRHLRWDDFAVHAIGWGPKSESIVEIARRFNIRLDSLVLIDDNPVERERVRQQLPGVRVLGAEPYYLKRVLLWSSETQRSVLTDESLHKTEMIRAQIERDELRQQIGRDQFLNDLDIRLVEELIDATGHLHFMRALEVLTKTSQFNTTGVQYTFEECQERLREGWRLLGWSARDRFTSYGVVAVAWLRANELEHFAMSCRVFGLGIEQAILQRIVAVTCQGGHEQLRLRWLDTGRNAPSRALWADHSFAPVTDSPDWFQRGVAQPVPGGEHVRWDSEAQS